MEMTNSNPSSPPILPSGPTPAEREASKKQNTIMVVVIAAIILFIAIIALAAYFLFQAQGDTTAKIRDIFLIFLALESLVLGVAMIVLIVQMASLINLLQNEVRPILHATSDTVNNLRGTVEFLGENVVEPVIKLNGYLAGMQRVLELFRIKQK